MKIIGEESIAKGIRRITALTGRAAVEYVRQEEEILGDLAATLRVPPAQVGQRVAALLEEIKTLKKQASQRPREAGAGVWPTNCSPRPSRSQGRRSSSGPWAGARPTSCGSSSTSSGASGRNGWRSS